MSASRIGSLHRLAARSSSSSGSRLSSGGPSYGLYSRGNGVFGALGQSRGSLVDSTNFRPMDVSGLAGAGAGAGFVVKAIACSWGHSLVLLEDGRLFHTGKPFDFKNLIRLYRIKQLSSRVARVVSGITNVFNYKIPFFDGSAVEKMNTNSSDKSSKSDLDEALDDGQPSDEAYEGGFYTVLQRVSLRQEVEHVVASAGLTVGITKGGQIFAYGSNQWGQCGIEIDEKKSTFSHIFHPRIVRQAKENVVDGDKQLTFPMLRFVGVDAGLQHCVALSSCGRVYSWGKGNRGQLGDGNAETSSLPVLVDIEGSSSMWYKKMKKTGLDATVGKVVAVTAGFNFSAALTSSGQVWVWGKGLSLEQIDAQRQTMQYCDQKSPRQVMLPAGLRCVEVVCSNSLVVMRMADGALWALGLGEYDRNMNIAPLPVQRAQPPQHLEVLEERPLTPEGLLAKYKLTEAPAALPSASRLVKAHTRVAVVVGDGASDDGIVSDRFKVVDSDRNRAGKSPTDNAIIYEVVMHDGEAFLKEETITIDGLGGRKVTPCLYSGGWQHSMVYVKV